jgi:hypothetical protein
MEISSVIFIHLFRSNQEQLRKNATIGDWDIYHGATTLLRIQLFQLRLSPSKAEKSNTSARVRLFRFARGQP